MVFHGCKILTTSQSVSGSFADALVYDLHISAMWLAKAVKVFVKDHHFQWSVKLWPGAKLYDQSKIQSVISINLVIVFTVVLQKWTSKCKPQAGKSSVVYYNLIFKNNPYIFLKYSQFSCFCKTFYFLSCIYVPQLYDLLSLITHVKTKLLKDDIVKKNKYIYRWLLCRGRDNTNPAKIWHQIAI